MTEFKAIETIYKGYRFRSRLEARWAVFFDGIGAPWEYEPEGFEADDGSRYLPDFRVDFNGTKFWVEVKGEPDFYRDKTDFLNKWVGPNGALPGKKVIALGAIPEKSDGVLFVRVYGGSALACWMMVAVAPGWRAGVLRQDQLVRHFDTNPSDIFNFQPFVARTPLGYPTINKALDAARMARFEHGESGRA